MAGVDTESRFFVARPSVSPRIGRDNIYRERDLQLRNKTNLARISQASPAARADGLLQSQSVAI